MKEHIKKTKLLRVGIKESEEVILVITDKNHVNFSFLHNLAKKKLNASFNFFFYASPK